MGRCCGGMIRGGGTIQPWREFTPSRDMRIHHAGITWKLQAGLRRRVPPAVYSLALSIEIDRSQNDAARGD